MARSCSRRSDIDINALMRKALELRLLLDQDQGACIRLHDLLGAVAADFKCSNSGQHLGNTPKAFQQILLVYIYELERVRSLSRGLFRLRRRKTLLESPLAVYKSLLKLLASSNINAQTKWMIQCSQHQAWIHSDIAIRRLVASLRGGSDKKKAQAARSLSEPNQVAIGRAQAIPPLVALLGGTDSQIYHAATALGNLMIQNQDNCTQTVGSGAIPLMLNMLETGTDRQKEAAAFALSVMTSSENNHDEIVHYNGIELLIPLLKGLDDQKRYATLALGNLISRSASHRSES